MAPNTLYYGDNLDILPLHQADRKFRKAPRKNEEHEALRMDVEG